MSFHSTKTLFDRVGLSKNKVAIYWDAVGLSAHLQASSLANGKSRVSKQLITNVTQSEFALVFCVLPPVVADVQISKRHWALAELLEMALFLVTALAKDIRMTDIFLNSAKTFQFVCLSLSVKTDSNS